MVSCDSFTFDPHWVIGKCNGNKRNFTFDSAFSEYLMHARKTFKLLFTVE